MILFTFALVAVGYLSGGTLGGWVALLIAVFIRVNCAPVVTP